MKHGSTLPSMIEPPDPSQRIQARFEINLPPEMEVGVFANFANIWQDNDLIIIDFASTANIPQIEDDENGNKRALVRSRVVSRVRIPPRQALELMRGLSAQLSTWEAAHGPVAEPPPD